MKGLKSFAKSSEICWKEGKKSSQNTSLYINSINFYTIRMPVSFLCTTGKHADRGSPSWICQNRTLSKQFQQFQVSSLKQHLIIFFSSEISLKEIEHLTVLTPYSRAFQGDFLQHFPLVVLPCLSVSPEKGGIHENKAQRFPISFGTMSS